MEEGFQFTPQLGLIIGGIVGIIIGWVIGFFDSNRNSSKKIKQAEASAQIAIQDAKDKIAQAETKMASMTATPVTGDDPGILRIKSEPAGFTLDLDGMRVNPAALYPDQRKRLIEMLNVMRPWLENKPVPMPAPAAPPPSPLPPVQAPVNYAPPPAQPVPATPAPASAPKPAASQKKEEPTGTAPTSMVGQINAILQTRIANTRLADVGVTMIESPGGGVYVYIGLEKYEGIDTIPDEEVKTTIRAAIAEWEKKYTPGI